MQQSIFNVTFVVRDYDEALAFFVGKLGFTLIEDTYIPEQDKRWVIVEPRGSAGTRLLLARASNDRQQAAVGNQTGGRVAFFLGTDDIGRDHRAMTAAGIKFTREPTEAAFGTAAVFEDLY